MIAIVLAAGYATRLYPLTENFPKPLLPVNEKPILNWLLDDLEEQEEITGWNMIQKFYISFVMVTFRPKKFVFAMLMKTAPEEIQYYHWGDMDYGGIQIFLYNEKNIFPNLMPWKMELLLIRQRWKMEKELS